MGGNDEIGEIYAELGTDDGRYPKSDRINGRRKSAERENAYTGQKEVEFKMLASQITLTSYTIH